MSSDADIEQLVEALQQDGPSERDAARLRARMSALGLATAAVAGHGTAAASVPVAKAAGSVATSLSTRWASLAFLPKMGVVAAVSAAAVGGPVYATKALERAPAAETSAKAPPPAKKPTRPVVVATTPARTDATATNATAETSPTNATARSVTKTAVNGAPRAAHRGAAVAAASSSGESTSTASAGSTVATSGEPAAPGSDTVGVARFTENGNTAEAPRPVPTGTTLAEETALVDAAFAALRAGDSANAAAFVVEHARRFPHGLLWRERERARAKLADLLAGQSPR